MVIKSLSCLKYKWYGEESNGFFIIVDYNFFGLYFGLVFWFGKKLLLSIIVN